MSYPYTLVAYSASGPTFCRGHVTDSWDSDLEVGQYQTFESAVSGAMPFVKSDAEGKSSWEITLYNVDGSEQQWPDSRSEDTFPAVLHAAHRTYREMHKAAIEVEALRKQQDAKLAQEASERSTYEELKKKYGE